MMRNKVFKIKQRWAYYLEVTLWQTTLKIAYSSLAFSFRISFLFSSSCRDILLSSFDILFWSFFFSFHFLIRSYLVEAN